MRGGLFIALTVGLILGVGAAMRVTLRSPPAGRPPSAGISIDLARDRAARVSGVQYELQLRIPVARSEPIRGRLTATFNLSRASRALAFDFAQPSDRLHSTTVNGRPLDAVVENGHIVLPPSHLVTGRNSATFTFTAGDEALNRQDDYLYSLFVPARASLAVPCLDQPNLKARWRLSLELPAGWTAISNGRESGRAATGNRVSLLFEETAPISTYLVAFAAGRFTIDSAERGGRTFRMFHRETDAARLARNREAIFDQHARALDWLEEYTGRAYAFGKFEFVLIPAFQFTGMEHPGAVFYNANALLLDEAATEQQHLARANVIAHETAHMWFGNLVTMDWFDDVWMKEVFANFLAAKIVNPSFPAINHELRFFVQHYPGAYDVDRTAGANPIRQSLENLTDAGSLYGAIIYQKAPIVMRQLEMLMGPDQLRDGLREYLTLFGFATATWTDLVQLLDARTPYDLEAWSRAWVSEAGRPTLATTLSANAGVLTRLVIQQADARGRDVVWPERLRVAMGRGDDVRTFDVMMDQPEIEVTAAAGLPVPEWVLPVAGGLAYGHVVLDPDTRTWLERRVHTIVDPVTRGAAYVAIWESMLEGAVAVPAMREVVLTSLPVERDVLNLQILLDQVRALFWRFTVAADRPALAARLERVLRAGLNAAPSTSEKAAWFATLRSVAMTPGTLRWLEAVWARRERIAGLPLAEIDESDLALDLAVRDVSSAGHILASQLARITSADRKARFAFVMPALSSDPAERARFFSGLTDVRNRGRETWVLDAARYLHHPLRAEQSAPFVRPALGLVLEIRRTGDIFFPKRWADATLAGYQSAAMAAEVRSFIDALPPDYPPRLKWVLLSAADPLFRAAVLTAAR